MLISADVCVWLCRFLHECAKIFNKSLLSYITTIIIATEWKLINTIGDWSLFKKFLKHCVKFPQQTKNRATIESSNPTPAKFKENHYLKKKNTCTPMFAAALFTRAKTWNYLRVHQQMNG